MTTTKQLLDWLDTERGLIRFRNRQTKYFLAGFYRLIGDKDVETILNNWEETHRSYYSHIHESTSKSYRTHLQNILDGYKSSRRKSLIVKLNAPKNVSPSSTLSEIYAWCRYNTNKCRTTATNSLVTFCDEFPDITWAEFLGELETILSNRNYKESTKNVIRSRIRSVDRSVLGFGPARPSVPMISRKSSRPYSTETVKSVEPQQQQPQQQQPQQQPSFSIDAIRSRVAIRRKLMEALNNLSPTDQQIVLAEVLIEVESRVS